MGELDLKSLRQLLVGNGDSALRDVLEECAGLCMRQQPIVRSQSSASSTATQRRNSASAIKCLCWNRAQSDRSTHGQ